MACVRTTHSYQNVIFLRQVCSDIAFAFTPILPSDNNVDTSNLLIWIYSKGGTDSYECVFSICIRYVQTDVGIFLEPIDIFFVTM